ncbi:MAG: GFA family protein [Candidatus Azotimanducaceae bacterium]
MFGLTAARSGRTYAKNFCSTGGSRLWADLDAGLATIAVGCLDAPANLRPTMVHCENDAPGWSRVPDRLASPPSG